MNFLIGSFYGHPKKHSDGTFYSNLLKLLNIIKTETKYVFIAGDFNYDLLKYSKDMYVTDILDLCYEHFLQPCILEPTRIIYGNRSSLIDNIFTNFTSKNIVSGNLFSKITDHMPNFAIVQNITVSKKREGRYLRDFSNLYKESDLQDLSESEIGHLISNDLDKF